jgi:hypothetical protein
MQPNFTQFETGKLILFILVATITIISLFVTTYISFVEVLYAAWYLVVVQLCQRVVAIADQNPTRMIQVCLSLLFGMPLVELVLTMAIQMLLSFLSNLWDIVSYRGVFNYVVGELHMTTVSKPVVVLKLIFLGAFSPRSSRPF